MKSFLKKFLILTADLFSIFISILLIIELEVGLNFISINENVIFILYVFILYILLWFLVKENRNVYRYFSNKKLIEVFIRCFFFFNWKFFK